ncbi:MAG: anaerobic sulfatase maturase [Candidatus Aminicenantes bacterium]|nr:MAG: anaerobic sulfatase maturase [Candidatus Aminicenantes bacterium]RPJ03128.1 MAG: anaerobic sulfatase maturase [Candidatus Aminicenantes bacterium]
MAARSRGFQVFAKPGGAACNLACRYCYYLDKGPAGPGAAPSRMPDGLLETYIAQHIAASPDDVIRFSWHGGEPTVLGLAYFRTIVEIERRLCPPGRTIVNGLQTNGTLLDEEWGRFLAAEGFSVGLSLDGSREIHDFFRLARDGRPSFEDAMRGYDILRRHGVVTDILCVVGAHNAGRPLEVTGFFREIGASFLTFIPLVEKEQGQAGGVTPESVRPEAWGDFLCAVFDEWVERDIGRVKIQIVEEAARTAFGQEHSLCIFRPVCGDIPALERNGDLFSCDHYVDPAHRLGNVGETPLLDLLEIGEQRAFGLSKLESLPWACRTCEVLEMCHGECPKNRFVPAPDGGPDLNYLCAGYRTFFGHVRPFVAAVAAEWRRENAG